MPIREFVSKITRILSKMNGTTYSSTVCLLRLSVLIFHNLLTTFFTNTNCYIYLVYLNKSDKMELNGAEHFVNNCIQQNDISWFPRLTSHTMQIEDVDESDALLSDISSRMTSLEANTEAHQSDMAARMLRIETCLMELSAKLSLPN